MLAFPKCSDFYVCVSKVFRLCVCRVSVRISLFFSQVFRLLFVFLLSVPTSMSVFQVFQLLYLYFPSVSISIFVFPKCSKFCVCISQVFRLLCRCMCLPCVLNFMFVFPKCSNFYVCVSPKCTDFIIISQMFRILYLSSKYSDIYNCNS